MHRADWRDACMDIVKLCPYRYFSIFEIPIDEQMIGTRCRVGFIQYMPAKPVKFSVKNWVLADSVRPYAAIVKAQFCATVYLHDLNGKNPKCGQISRKTV